MATRQLYLQHTHSNRHGHGDPLDGRIFVEAYLAHPERFVNKAPVPPNLPEAVCINKPEELATTQ